MSIHHTRPCVRSRVAASAIVGMVAGWLGLLSGMTPGTIALMALGLPVLAYFLLGRFPIRVVASGGAAALLGVAILSLQPTGVSIGWGDAALVGMLVPVALVGNRFARSVPASNADQTLDPDDGRWFTVVVAGQGPAPGAGRTCRLPTMPRNDPERRRLSRRVERKRELVCAGTED